MGVAIVLGDALEAVLSELLKVVVVQMKKTAKFKTLLKHLEKTLKNMEPVFYESWRLSKVLDRPEKETKLFIFYLENGKEVVLKCSRINCWNVHKRIVHANKLIRLNNELLRFFQIGVEANMMSTSMRGLIGIYDLGDKMDQEFIVGLDRHLEELKCRLLKDDTQMLSNLKIIRFEHVSLSPFLQPIFPLPNLQKLSFITCKIRNSLNSFSTETPYMLPNLTELEIDGCYDLTELPDGLCSLVHLQKLSITNCHELVALPSRLGNLSNLEILNLHCCTKLQELPGSIGSLGNLKFVDISDCLGISELPEQIGELRELRVVKMSGCGGLQELPEGVQKLRELEEVICDEETSYLWSYYEDDLSNLMINVVEEDRFGSFMKIVQ